MCERCNFDENWVISLEGGQQVCRDCGSRELQQKANRPYGDKCIAQCLAAERCGECTESGKPCLKCKYAKGYYNTSENLIVKFDLEFDEYNVTEKQEDILNDHETDGVCQLVPRDVASIDPSSGEISVKAGYAVIKGRQESRERSQIQDDDGDDLPAVNLPAVNVWGVFKCGHPSIALGAR